MAILNILMNLSAIYIAALFIFIIVILLGIIDYFYKKLKINHFYLRKAIHAIVGIFVVVSSFFFENNTPILIIAVFFAIANCISIFTGRLTSIHGRDKSFGTVYYPITIFLLALFFWENHVIIFRVSILIMTISDALAAVIGVKLGKNKFILIKDHKSVIGSLAMFVSTILIVFIGLILSNTFNLLEILIIAVCIGLIATASELLSINGSDNLSVPIMSSLFLFAFLNESSVTDFSQLMIGIFTSLLIVFFSLKAKFLQLSGAVTAFLLGSIIYGFGGLDYTLPILAFFILSSLLSFLGKTKKIKVEKAYEKTGTRDYAQVLANGGLAGIFVILYYFYQLNYIYIVYLSVIAAVTADTWATELGFFSKKLPRLITNFKQVPKGTSGAVSLTGTFFSIIGTIVIAGIGYFLSRESYIYLGIYFTFLIIITAGTISCFLDSLIGATIQAQYLCTVCDSTTEKHIHCNMSTIHKSGNKHINNDIVNIVASFFGAVYAYVFLIKIIN